MKEQVLIRGLWWTVECKKVNSLVVKDGFRWQQVHKRYVEGWRLI